MAVPCLGCITQLAGELVRGSKAGTQQVSAFLLQCSQSDAALGFLPAFLQISRSSTIHHLQLTAASLCYCHCLQHNINAGFYDCAVQNLRVKRKTHLEVLLKCPHHFCCSYFKVRLG